MPLKRSWKCESGNIMLVFALLLSGLVLMVGLALDTTRLMGERSSLQSATDAAVLEAAVALRDNPLSYEARGERVFINNVATSGWAKAPSIKFFKEGDRVVAKATATAKTLFMSAIGSNLFEISAQASATAISGPPICTLGMSTNLAKAIQWQNNADFDAVNCVIHANSSHPEALYHFGTRDAEATGFCAVGAFGGNASRFSSEPRTNCTPIADPTFAVPDAPVGTCKTVVTIPAGTTQTITPGRYCNGLTIRGDATFLPGIYSFEDRLIITDNANVDGDEVLLQFWGPQATFEFSGNARVRLTATKADEYNGILMTHEPNGAERLGKFEINSQSDLTGAIYLPSFNIVLSENTKFGLTTDYVALIANSAKFEGNSRVRMSAKPVLAGYDDRLPRAFYMPRLLN